MMAIGPTELAAILAASGVVIGGITRPVCKWLTARTFAAKARPEDLPKIAEALNPPIRFNDRLSRGQQPNASDDVGAGESNT